MQIDPKFQVIGMYFLAALGVIANLSPSMFPSYIPAGETADIIKTAGLLFAVASGIGGSASLFSSSKPGPLAPADPPVVVAATKLTAANSTAQVNAAKTELNTEIAKH